MKAAHARLLKGAGASAPQDGETAENVAGDTAMVRFKITTEQREHVARRAMPRRPQSVRRRAEMAMSFNMAIGRWCTRRLALSHLSPGRSGVQFSEEVACARPQRNRTTLHRTDQAGASESARTAPSWSHGFLAPAKRVLKSELQHYAGGFRTPRDPKKRSLLSCPRSVCSPGSSMRWRLSASATT